MLRSSWKLGRRPFSCWALALFVLAPAGAAAQTCDTINQWQPWNKTITLTGTSSLGSNPYRDYVIRVTFHSATSGAFTQDAFWDNDPASPKSFKIRAALPAGTQGISTTWTWDTITCTPNAGGVCPALTWSQSTGCITVQSSTTTGVKLYDNGFLKQYSLVSGGTTVSYSPLFYWNDTPFFWLADTAWAAPPREIYGQTATWVSYLAERRGKFTALLVAPAVTWTPKNIPPEFTALPAAPGFSFDQTSGTSTDPIPNLDSKPIKTYWDKFDTLVAQANQQDLVVLVAGLIDPIDRGGASGARYPRVQDAKNFARYLAARLANRAVIFSPGFDDRLGDLTKDNVALSSALSQVGQAIKTAAPRQIVTNHLAANSPCSDYELFRSPSSWMTVFAFQSGHGGGNINSPPGTVCGSPYVGEAPVVAAVRRSIEMPQTLSTSGNLPFLYGFNSEGPYDTVPAPNPPDPVDNRYRVRQVAYDTCLSNALGFTYGVVKLSLWDSPALSTFQADSAKLDMASLRTRFENRAPSLTGRASWILNQQGAYDKKMELGTDGSNLVIAYVPGSPTASITIGTSGLPGLGCGWAASWFVPMTNAPVAALCQPGVNQIVFTKPACNTQRFDSDCDWVLELKRGGAAVASTLATSVPQRLDTEAVFSPADGTSAIAATLTDARAQKPSAPIIVSPAGFALQQEPQVVPLAKGYLIVWHAEGLDGSLLGVFAQQIDGTGKLAGTRMQVNLTSEENQRDPAIAADALGNSMIVWSSYGQDGDRGGIFGRRIDSSGRLAGGELAINTRTQGHQEQPRIVSLPGGRFVVAWQTRAEEKGPGEISLRVFDGAGRAVTGEMAIPGTPGLRSRLVNLEVSPSGVFHVDWALDEPARAAVALYSRTFDSAGLTLGPAVPLP